MAAPKGMGMMAALGGRPLKGAPKGDMPYADDGDGSDAEGAADQYASSKMAAAESLIDAMKSGDAKAVLDAFAGLKDLC